MIKYFQIKQLIPSADVVDYQVRNTILTQSLV